MGDKLKMIPLCQLQRSKINVRKTEPLIDIGQLAANIAEKGLLENLVVRPVPRSGRKTAEYDVELKRQFFMEHLKARSCTR